MASDTPRRNPDYAHRSVAGEGGLVVVPSESKVEVLNPVADKIFKMLDGTNRLDEIVAAVVEEFDISEDEARRDTEAFLSDLEERGMLVKQGAAS